MDNKKREVNPIYFSLLSLITIINTFMFLRVIITFSFHRLFTHETLWSFYLSTIYLGDVFKIFSNTARYGGGVSTHIENLLEVSEENQHIN